MAKKKADEPTGVEEKVEAPTADSPESESPEEKPEADQPQEEPKEQESPESETGKNEEGEEAPKDNVAWAKMRKENKRLKKALESVDPEYLAKLKEATIPQSYKTPEPSYLPEDADYTQVTGTLNATQQEMMRLRQEVAEQRRQLELAQDKQAEEAYPSLKTDKVFQQMVAEKKLAARVLGQERTTLEIAREVNNLLSRREEQVAAKSAQEKEQEIAEKRQAIAEAKGVTSGGKSAVKDEKLRERVRKGDMEATTEVAKKLIANLDIK